MNNSGSPAPKMAEKVRVRILPDGRMTRDNAAQYLGLKPKTLAMWAYQGKGPSVVRVGGRCFYFKGELDRFIERNAPALVGVGSDVEVPTT